MDYLKAGNTVFKAQPLICLDLLKGQPREMRNLGGRYWHNHLSTLLHSQQRKVLFRHELSL